MSNEKTPPGVTGERMEELAELVKNKIAPCRFIILTFPEKWPGLVAYSGSVGKHEAARILRMTADSIERGGDITKPIFSN